MTMKFSILFVLFVCISGAFGQPNSSFYVSTTGDDSNPGTQAAPWRTVQHAADTVGAGSTVNVRGGIYQELVSLKASGNATDGFIIFRSYPGETAVLDAEHFAPNARSAVRRPPLPHDAEQVAGRKEPAARHYRSQPLLLCFRIEGEHVERVSCHCDRIRQVC